MSAASKAETATFSLRPSVAVSEEYNDNIFLESEDVREEYITRVMPSLTFQYQAPRWEWDMKYMLDYRYYAKELDGDEVTHDLALKGRMNFLKEFFFIDVADEFQRVSLDIARDFTRESLVVSQSDRNIFRVNPYLKWRLGPSADLRTGYTYLDVWYEVPEAIDKRDDIAYADAEMELTPRVGLNAGYRFTQEKSDTKDFTKNDARLGCRYEYAEDSFIHAGVGNAWLDFDSGTSYSQIFWEAGISHASGIYEGSLNAALEFNENPAGDPLRVERYTASLRRTRERSLFGISATFRDYTDAVTERLDTRRYGAEADIRYAMTSRTVGLLGFAADRFERRLLDAVTRRYLLDAGVEYELLEDFTATLLYRLTESESPEIAEENFTNNRVLAVIKKSF